MLEIIFQSSKVSSVLPKKNSTAQGQDLNAPAADIHILKVPRPGMFPWWGWCKEPGTISANPFANQLE